MPSFAWKMSDTQVAAVSTYIRNNWGNAASAVTSDDVAKARKQQKATAQLSDGTAK
jgi:mono/diheme cytochrome c family protein